METYFGHHTVGEDGYAETSGIAGSLFASFIPGDRDHEFSGK
jgi:hypothetical protein